jgi:hypothetical protein
MQSYTIYIDDDRLALPVRRSVQLADGVAVEDWARTLLGESEHHRTVEVFKAANSLFKIRAPAPVEDDRP